HHTHTHTHITAAERSTHGGNTSHTHTHTHTHTPHLPNSTHLHDTHHTYTHTHTHTHYTCRTLHTWSEHITHTHTHLHSLITFSISNNVTFSHLSLFLSSIPCLSSSSVSSSFIMPPFLPAHPLISCSLFLPLCSL